VGRRSIENNAKMNTRGCFTYEMGGLLHRISHGAGQILPDAGGYEIPPSLGGFRVQGSRVRYHLGEELIRQLPNVRLRGDRDLAGRICEEGVASFVRARD